MTDNLLSQSIDTPSEDTPVAAPSPQNPLSIPEKFLDKATGHVRLEALINSYLALEKRLSKMVPIPENDDDKERILRLLGRPDTPDQYDIKLSHDVITLDPELNARLHRNGFTNAQVQEIYDLAAEKLVPMILEMATEFQSDREIERLTEYFGGADAWREMARQLKDFGQKNLPPSAFEGLACSYEGVLALHNMMKGGVKAFGTAKDSALSAHFDEDSLRKMMQSPKYWREKDPAFIAEVSAGFEKLYGQKT